MLGENAFHPYKINTFSREGKPLLPPVHYVSPHPVSSYRRGDGTFVSGYWRDGDGDTSVNRPIGYFSRNPSPIPDVLKKGR